MITLITGAPGSGKSNALVSLLEELGKDRPLFVNGIPELKIPHNELEDLADWPTAVPDGACIIGDECQSTFRPRGPGQKVPAHVSELETHRHRGLDFYLITQGPNLVDSNVRALVGRHIHLRDLGLLGRWWYEWPECADNCRTGWKNAPIKKRYKLDKSAQAKYRSASIHVKPVRSIPMAVPLLVAALAVVGFLTWKSYGVIQAKVNPARPEAIAAKAAPGQTSTATSSSTSSSSGATLIDDRVDWFPRISSRPESAPAYDKIRTVVVMPVVIGCAMFKGVARCFTQQGTDAGLSHLEALAWLQAPRFDPYRAPEQVAKGSAPAAEKKPAESLPGPSVNVFDAGSIRMGSSPIRQPQAAASEAPRRPLANGHSAPGLEAM